MENFLLGLHDRYNILPNEDDLLCINEDVFIFFTEANNGILLLCPCFPVPTQQRDLAELLSLNCKGEVNFCAGNDLILAKLILKYDDDFDEMMDKFGWYVDEILSAMAYFGHVPRQEVTGRFA